MARELEKFSTALRKRLADCAALEVQAPVPAANEAVLAPGRGRRVTLCICDRTPRTIIISIPDKVCAVLVEFLDSVNALDANEVQLSNTILGFCTDCVRSALGAAAATQSLAPPTITRSAVAVALGPGVSTASATLNTTKGAVGITCAVGALKAAQPAAAASKRKRVLIVDDDVDARKLLARAVADLDVEFTAVDSGAEALAAINEVMPDMVLLDFELPVMDGHECLIRMRQAVPALQIIMVTARGTADVVKKCVEGGAAGFIVKPFRIADLQQRIRRTLGLPEPVGAV